MPHTDMPLVRHNLLYRTDHRPIQVDTNAWFIWLRHANRFCYQPATTSYRLTVRKEKRRHAFYWYAYLRSERKLHNAYVGRTEQVTKERLEQVLLQLITKVVRFRQEQTG